MKKTALLTALILTVALAATAFTACVDTDLSAYGYPEGFEETLAEYDFTRGEDVDVRIMSFNILAHMESWGGSPVQPRAKLLLRILGETAPDAVCVQEMSSDWHKVLEANMVGNYALIHPDIDIFNKNKTTIIYDTDKLDLIESGYKAYKQGDENGSRAITWGLFCVKATGKYVIVTDTHLNLVKSGQEERSLEIMNAQVDELAALVSELRGKYSFSVIACGDYNCSESGEKPDYSGTAQGALAAETVYKKLATYFKDAKYGEGTQIVCRDEAVAAAPAWDHIFVDGDATAKRFFVLDGEVFENLSDHYAIFADFSL